MLKDGYRILFGIEAKVVGFRPDKGYGEMLFEAKTTSQLSEEMASKIQMELGYHPAGYGGPYNLYGIKNGNSYTYTWCCRASCD